ncbi:MAG: pseudouridine synthase [Bacteroidia bacterium]
MIRRPNKKGKPAEKRDFSPREGDSEKRSFGGDDRKSFGEKKSFTPRERDGEKRSFGSDDRKKFGEKKSFTPRERDGEKRSFGGDDRKSFGEKKRFTPRERDGEKRSFGGDDRKKFGEKKSFTPRERDGEKRSFGGDDRKKFGEKKGFTPRERDGEKRSFGGDDRKKFGEKKSFTPREVDDDNERSENTGEKKYFATHGKRNNDKYDLEDNHRKTYEEKTRIASDGKPLREELKKSVKTKKAVEKDFAEVNKELGLIRLNKYIANAGVCSRREADQMIATGVVSVNGKIITEMGFRVKATDIVNYGGQTLRHEKNVYLLLNKPKDFITTVEDARGRRTVMELVQGACNERIYPVGRLDRNTTGLLMFTNDGEMTDRLTHPRYGIKKIYHVTLDQNVAREDIDKISEGIELEDGFIKADEISYVDGAKDEIGIEIHSGRNRIIRRIFETLGYKVLRLDRVYFGGLTKKNLPKGRWRLLTEQEIIMLKMVPK